MLKQKYAGYVRRIAEGNKYEVEQKLFSLPPREFEALFMEVTGVQLSSESSRLSNIDVLISGFENLSQ